MESVGEEGIIVAVRIRPLSKKEISSGIVSCCQTLGESNIAIRKNGDANGYLKSQQAILNEYAFDAVFDESSTQEEVYQSTAKKFIPNVINGKNVTVFAYGATGAGKTHTMLGNSRADASAKDSGLGIIPCAVKDMFAHIADRYESADDINLEEKWTVTLSYIEVYNEQVYDLLGGAGKALAVREDQTKDIVVVAGMTEQVVASYDEVMVFMAQGNRNRKTEATMANAVSSRSHAVLQLVVRHSLLKLDTNKETAIESKLSLIDLAGSERASATNNRGARLQEGANINKSLLALANCINALAENAGNDKKSNVKFRDSKLTHLLKSSLEGNCNLIMIANINPSDTTYEDSNNTLKYANRAKNIKVNPVVQEVVKESTWLERELRLRQENATLRNRVCELTKLLTEAQSFRDNVLFKCSNGACLEDIKHLVDELDECFENIRSTGSSNSDSDTSFNADTSHEGSPASNSSPEASEVSESMLSERFGRGKRRASISTSVPTASTSAMVSVKPSAAKSVPVPSKQVPVEDAALSEFDDCDVAVAAVSCVSGNTRRRQSSVPAPVTTTASARQSARRASLAPKLSATAAALKAVAEIAVAPVPTMTSVPTKASSKSTDSVSRITRRKSTLLSASAPITLSAISEDPEVEVKTTAIEEKVLADVESGKPKSDVVVEPAPAVELTVPTVDDVFEDPTQTVASSNTQRRALLRRTSIGASSSGGGGVGASGSAIPQLGEARTSRRKSIADVTAMLASIDSISSLVKPTTATTVDTSLKKRGAAEEVEEVHDENKKRRKGGNSRMSLSSVLEANEIPQHVWIDI